MIAVACFLVVVAWAAWDNWTERRAIAQAERQEQTLAHARQTNALAAEVLAQVERKRVTVDRRGFALVRASCPEEAANIVAQSSAFGARDEVWR